MGSPVVETTPIPGLLVVRLPVHRDARGWFKENWQREKMIAAGLPDFQPVQNNISFNSNRGATRGIHAEPWDKFISVVTGRVFAAWVDMREGESFGKAFSIVVTPDVAVFVPRGVGNSYQALANDTCYNYLVNEHWRPADPYPALDLADPTAAIPWPIPLDAAEVSEKDRQNPRLESITPVPPLRTLILGANGQLGRALIAQFPEAHAVSRAELDITDPVQLDAWAWNEYDTVLNAAAYTAVDEAQANGRTAAWATNATGPAQLARLAQQHRLTLVHYSTDYVFDGVASSHDESEPLSPLGVYGQSKAAGDLAVANALRHYILRTSWVIGDGPNFVRTLKQLASNGSTPTVVSDQVGRLTFADELARATAHLLGGGAPFGTYNVTNSGVPVSWYEIAAQIFRLSGRDPDDVTPITTDEYAGGRTIAPRPSNSVLCLDKLIATGFTPRPALPTLRLYLPAHDSQRD